MPETQGQQFNYLPHTDKQRAEMLKAIGAKSIEDLLSHIPSNLRLSKLDLPAGLSEPDLVEHISALAAKNKPASRMACFLGGGSYRRFVPAAVPALVSRSEFATAYTPYQPEVSQGSLQAIYEFQTAVCLLTGMDVANASMYDGQTACAEAALMASRLTGRSKIIVSESLNPDYRQVTATYLNACGLTMEIAPAASGIVEVNDLALDGNTAAVIVQNPNYFGCLEDLNVLAQATHAVSALLVVVSEPISLGLLAGPGDSGADIVVGDAQPCGNNLSFGGPSAGYMATRTEFVRQLPGRLAGMTVDNSGRRAFTLTLQTREQHIRRAKATSNICTNQALNALTMLVYLTLLGPQGLRDVAEISLRRAHFLAEKLCRIDGVSLLFNKPYFNEFAIKTKLPAKVVLKHLAEQGIAGGLDLSSLSPALQNSILIAVTEMNSVSQLDLYARHLSDYLSQANEKASVAMGKRDV